MVIESLITALEDWVSNMIDPLSKWDIVVVPLVGTQCGKRYWRRRRMELHWKSLTYYPMLSTG